MNEKQKGLGLLAGYRVLDVTNEIGPLCSKILGDLGADVIKIEQPISTGAGSRSISGMRHSPDFQNLHRNKRGIVLNLKSKEILTYRVFWDYLKMCQRAIGIFG